MKEMILEKQLYYGQMFKELRTNRQFTLKQVANDTVSVAQLSKFERGESDLSLTKFLSALKSINVSVTEFMNRVNDYQRFEQADLMSRMARYYYDSDIQGLENLIENQNIKAKQDLSNPRPRLNAIMFKGLICQLDDSYKMKQSDLDYVSDYLFQVEHWGMDELILSGNLMEFYPTDLICRRVREILSREEFYAEISQYRQLVEATLLNTIIICSERGDLDRIPEFDQALQTIFSKKKHGVNNRIDYLYAKGFYHYVLGDNSGITDMKKAIATFEMLECHDSASYYQKHFDRHIH
ncbi:Rgg family transcriptional regulator [Streptococcus orisratti]